jgi:hypothetical protein
LEHEMAFKLRHWLVAALAGCALVAVALLPVQIRQYRMRGPVGSNRVSRLRSQLWTAYQRLHELEVRESVMSRAHEALLTSQGAPALILDPGIPREGRAELERALEEPLRILEPPTPTVALAIAVVLDTVPSERGGGLRIRYFVPDSADDAVCLSLISLHDTLADYGRGWWFEPFAREEQADTVDALLGPCAYYRAFGLPGPDVERWLRETEFATARRLVWATGGPPLERMPGDEVAMWRSWRIGLTACATGNRSACRRALFGREATSYLSAGSGAAVRYRYWSPYFSELGPQEWRFLSDVVSEFGRERFAAFWSSEEPVERAFQAATGTDLVDWTMQWCRAQLGKLRSGPAASASSTILALLLAAALAAATAAFAGRRQVS